MVPLSCMYLYLVVQWLSCVWLLATPPSAACQASLSFTISQSSLKLMSIESVMPSNHLILCRRLLLLTSIFPSIRVFSNESALCIRKPEYLGQKPLIQRRAMQRRSTFGWVLFALNLRLHGMWRWTYLVSSWVEKFEQNIRQNMLI